MKKFIASSLLAASMLLVATPVLAKNDHDDNGRKGKGWGNIRRIFKGPDLSATQFVVVGTVDSATTTSVMIKQTAALHVPTITNGMVVVKIDANTKITGDKKQAATTADLKNGVNVVISGNISGADLVATKIGIVRTVEKIEKNQKAVGKVTAKTDTSVTITNGLTNEAKTITTDADTKVIINGETKTLADIQVGDSGWVKIKTVGSNLVAKVFRLFR